MTVKKANQTPRGPVLDKDGSLTKPWIDWFNREARRIMNGKTDLVPDATNEVASFDDDGNLVNKSNLNELSVWDVTNIALAQNVKTVQGGSTTITTTGNAFANMNVGDKLTANSVSKKILTKPDNNTATVATAVDWYNGGAGYAATFRMSLQNKISYESDRYDDLLADVLLADDDGVITPIEKRTAQQLWEMIEARGNTTNGTLYTKAGDYGLLHGAGTIWANYDAKYAALYTFLFTTLDVFNASNLHENLILSDFTLDRDDWDTAWEDYDNAEELLRHAFTDVAKLDAANAQADATAAKNDVGDILADTKISKGEKKTLYGQWQEIKAEANTTDGTLHLLAEGLGVSTVAFDTAYADLYTYMETLEYGDGKTLFEDYPNCATTDLSEPRADNFDLRWRAYWNKRTGLVKSCNEKASTMSTWSGVSDDGHKPDDDATVGADINAGNLKNGVTVLTAGDVITGQFTCGATGFKITTTYGADIIIPASYSRLCGYTFLLGTTEIGGAYAKNPSGSAVQMGFGVGYVSAYAGIAIVSHGCFTTAGNAATSALAANTVSIACKDNGAGSLYSEFSAHPIVINNGTAIANPSNACQFYASDNGAAQSCPTFETENGDVVRLWTAAHVTDAVTGGGATAADCASRINAILTRLEGFGLLATS